MTKAWMQRNMLPALLNVVVLVGPLSQAESAMVTDPVANGAGAGTAAQDTASPAGDAAPDPDVRSGEGNSARPPARATAISRKITGNVARLARKLDLDPGQQERVRLILMDQHARVMALRNNPQSADGDVAGSILAIYDQTRERIRSVLNEDQKKKYFADVPRGELAPAHADLQHWLDVRDGRASQEQTGETSK